MAHTNARLFRPLAVVCDLHSMPGMPSPPMTSGFVSLLLLGSLVACTGALEARPATTTTDDGGPDATTRLPDASASNASEPDASPPSAGDPDASCIVTTQVCVDASEALATQEFPSDAGDG